jgi:hypothetical protein
MITSQYEGRTNKKERQVIDALFSFISKIYFPKHKVHVTFKFMEALEKNEGIEGDVDWEETNKEEFPDYPISTARSPRVFTIRIQKGYDFITFLTLIAHELVHVKQYVLGQLCNAYVTSEYRTVFNGKDVTDVDYFKQPHEKEAYKLQEKIVNQFLKTYK